MKHHCSGLVFWFSVAAAAGLCLLPAAQGATVLVDFGSSASYRGVSVASPDHRGSYWNVFTPGDYLANMVNSSNQATSIDLGFTTAIGTDSNNGPAGPTSDPPTPGEIANTSFDAAALGDLGATNAVFDYVGIAPGNKAKFTLEGLNPAKRYNLSFFGSHKYPNGEVADSMPSRTTVYAATDSSGSNVLASVGLVVGVFGDHNSNTVVTLAGLAPDPLSKIYLEFSGQTSTNAGYLNCLRIDEVDPPTPPPSDETILVDFGNNSSYRGLSVANPDHNGRFWNSVNSAAFYPDMIDTHNQPTTVGLGFDAAGLTDSYNGPAGPTSDPPTPGEIANTSIDAAALGELGATNAVFDFYESSRFQIQGLAPGRTYRLTFFGSRKYSTDYATIYSVYTDSSYTSVVASATLSVRSPTIMGDHNSNLVAVIENLSPQAGNILYVGYRGHNGNEGYLNAMRIETYFGGLSYNRWATNYPSLGGRFDDDDSDRLVNLAEFGFGGNPTNGQDTGFSPSLRMVQVNGSNVFAYAYARRIGDTGLEYQAELCSDLRQGDWTNTGYVEVSPAAPINADFESVTNLVPATHSQQFMRAVIYEP